MTSSPPPLRLGVVFENTVGHVTFAQTLADALTRHDDVSPSFYPVSVPPRGLVDRLSLLEHNWSLHASLDARAIFLRHPRELDALLFHTQTLSLLSVGVMRRIPSVISLDATPVNFDEVGVGYGHYPDSDAREAFKRALVRRPLRAARGLVAWSEWVRRSLVDDYAIEDRRIEVIPAGTSLARHPRRTGERRPGPPRVLFVGGAFDRKGGPLLVSAVREVSPGLQVDVVTHEDLALGEGFRVHTGLRPGDATIDRLYADADLFVLPTRGDASPHVVLEAMAAGLPVITTRLGAIPEVVRHGETGLLIEIGDQAGLVAGLRRLTGDLALGRRMGEAGRRRAVEHFDARANVERILDFVRSFARVRRV